MGTDTLWPLAKRYKGKEVEPILEGLAGEYDGKVKIGKINEDQNPFLASKYQIKGVPTFILFNSGRPVQQRVGVQSKEQFKQMLNKML